MPHRFLRWAVGPGLALFAVLFFCGLPMVSQAPPASQAPANEARPAAPRPLPPELARIEKTEGLIEDFADALKDLAIHLMARNREAALGFFADKVSFRPFPTQPGPLKPDLKWIQRRTWTPGVSRDGSPEDLLKSLEDFLATFSEVDYLWFDLLDAELETLDGPPPLAGTVRVSVRGRNRQGQREWVQGEARVKARMLEDEESWRVMAFNLESLASQVAERDLFNEVSGPAGIALTEPTRVFQFFPHGAAAHDVDQDGLLDLFVTGPEVNRLYLGQGDGTFKDAAAGAGVTSLVADKAEWNPLFLDYDNDGDSDLFLTWEAGTVLLENRLVPDHRLLFRDVSAGLPALPERFVARAVAVGDINRDGLPDLFLTNYGLRGKGPQTTVDDTEGGPSQLWVNQGGGTFKEEGRARGVAEARFSVSAQFADIDNDQDLDLYVANDFGGGNALYVNQGNGHFVDDARQRGAWLGQQSMGVSFADYDNDGDLDLHVTNMSARVTDRAFRHFSGDALRGRDMLVRQWSGDTLLENLGDGKFRDVSAKAGPFLSEWAWGGGFLDVDNDGLEDLHAPNGMQSGDKPYDVRSFVFTRAILAAQTPDRALNVEWMRAGLGTMFHLLVNEKFSFGGWTPDKMYLNRGDGRYLDISGVSGSDTVFHSDARASVYADFDNDGDLDMFIRAAHGQAHSLFRNEVGQDRPFLRLSLEGRASGRDAFGTVVQVKTASGRLTKSKHGNNGFLDQNDPRLLFGLGEAKAVESIEVRWPSGKVQTFKGLFPAGASLKIVEGEDQPVAVQEKRFRL